jgi:lysophospholipase L1-like esterase
VTPPPKTLTLRWYHKLILIVLSLLFAVFLVEIAARVFRLLPGQSDAEYREVSRRVGLLSRPYDHFTTHGFVAGNTEFEIDIRLNKLGFRGDDVDQSPPNGQPRILLLGDSYTASWEVEDDQRWSEWLRRGLNTGGARYDVVNLGYPGFGTDREYLLYESYARQLNADLVLLVMYVENDVSDNGVTEWKTDRELRQKRPFFTLDDNGALIEHAWTYRDPTRPWERQSFPASMISWLNGNSLTYRLTRDALRAGWARITGGEVSDAMPEGQEAGVDPRHPTVIPRELNIFFTEPDERWETSWQITGALLAALRDSVTSDGAQLVVVIIPPHMIVQNDYWVYNDLFAQSDRAWDLWYPQNRMIALLNDLNIPAVNLTPSFIDFRAATGQDVFYKLDRHLNPAGSCLFGTALANWLAAQGYAEAGPPRDVMLTCGA